MYTGPDLQICQLLGIINGNHEFILPCKKREASALQIYTYIKAINNNNDLLIPLDIMQIIMTHVCIMTIKEHESCYMAAWAYKSIPDVIISFIEESLNKSKSHTTIANILKKTLRISEKSLGEIKCQHNENIFQHLFFEYCNRGGGYRNLEKTKNSLYWAEILCSLAENHAWDLIIEETKGTESAFFYACALFNVPVFKKFLQTAPSQEEIGRIISKSSEKGDTILDLIMHYESGKGVFSFVNHQKNIGMYMINTLLSLVPNNKEAWELITRPNPKDGQTALDIAKYWASYFLKQEEPSSYTVYVFSNFPRIVDILESYRSKI